VLKELRRVPPGFAVFLVLGAAAVTMIVLAAFDNSVDRTEKKAGRPAADRSQGPVFQLGGKYPKAAAPGGRAPAQQTPSARVPLRRLVGQKLMVRMAGTSASAELLARVRRGEVGGVILFADNLGSAAQLKSLTASLMGAARASGSSGFLISVDQEGGPVKRLTGGPPNVSPAQIATAASARQEGSATGTYLASRGVNVNLAPVLDVPAPGSFIASRAFGNTPSRVAKLGVPFADGLQHSGVAATAKHFPGLGHATANTDTGPSVVSASRAALDADLEPFATAITAGVSLVMMSNASYPAYGSGPAVLSSAVVQGQLRRRLRFGGVIVTDDLEAGAVRAVMPPSTAAVAASKAGVDMILLARTPGSSIGAFDALLSAARSGQLSRASLEQSYKRIQELQSTYAR
jgi:beta-N-acetylhexosaminidase